jgi:glycosyltransferase involved in cell wall biosynthesis
MTIVSKSQFPRVLQLFEPPDGGVPEHVLLLALGLADQGIEVELAGPPSSQIYSRAREAGVRVHTLPFRRDYGHPWDDALAWIELRALIRSRRPALLHCHASKAGAIGRSAAVGMPTRALYTPHCFGFVGDVGRARQVLVPQAERMLGRLSARIVCVCRDEMMLAQEHHIGTPDRLTLVYYGIPDPTRDPVPDPALSRLRAGGPLLANVSALRPQKRQDVFLEATAIALSRNPSARVALVGSGPLESTLRARAARLELDREPRFAFLPFQPPVERFLSAIDGLVLCSDWEALPISLLEGLAWGVPQVGTAVSGIPEIVTPRTGLLVPPRDPAALAEAMLILLDDRTDREAMSAASRARHRELFTLERMLERTGALYREILSE